MFCGVTSTDSGVRTKLVQVCLHIQQYRNRRKLPLIGLYLDDMVVQLIEAPLFALKCKMCRYFNSNKI